MLLHGFEERGLGFRGCAVDFVREDQVGEDGTADEGEAAAFGRFGEDFGAGDIGRHQVGRELDALEVKVEDLREGFDEEGLGEAGGAGEEAMAAGEKGEEELFDDLTLADDDFGEFGGNAFAAGLEALVSGFVGERWGGFDHERDGGELTTETQRHGEGQWVMA